MSSVVAMSSLEAKTIFAVPTPNQVVHSSECIFKDQGRLHRTSTCLFVGSSSVTGRLWACSGTDKACNQQRAAYLFQPDKNNTHLDIGDKTIMCGRKGDAFKLWLSWQHRGDAGWAKEAERAEALSAWFEAKVSDPSDPRFALALPRSGCNICFWVIPSALRTAQQKYDHQSSDEATREILHKVAPKVKDAMQKGGDAQIGFQVVLGLPNCFRIVLPSSSRIRQESLEKMLDRMSLLADAL